MEDQKATNSSTTYQAGTGAPPDDAPIGRKIMAHGVPIMNGQMWPDIVRGEPITALVIRMAGLEVDYRHIPSRFVLCNPMRGHMEVDEWWEIVSHD